MAERDVIIAGAGIVGLATALKMLGLYPGLKLTVLEKRARACKTPDGQ